MTPLEKAEWFARRSHCDQVYDGTSYADGHLRKVVAWTQLLCQIEDLQGFCPDLLTAAWLHDVVEDCGTPVSLIESEFGPYVARIVDALTDPPGPNRKARKAAAYPRIRAAGDEAVLVKLADRLANVTASLSHGTYFNMYKKEHEAFRAALYTYGHLEKAWALLDGLLQ